MKRIFIAAIISVIGLNANAQIAKKPITVKKTTTTKKAPVKSVIAPKPFKSTLDSASYAFGFSMASQLKSGGLKQLNYDQMVAGLKDVFNNAKPALTQQQCQDAITALFNSFSKERMAQEKLREEETKKQYMPTINEGNEFLAKNKVKPGVKTTPSGLQYEIITPGTGAKPTSASDKVTVNYKGTLLNGLEFDSSYKRNEPTSFGLNQVIPGWTEGLQLMNVGAKYRFFIPYNLAYGGREMGQIPPFSTLIFEVELLKIGE